MTTAAVQRFADWVLLAAIFVLAPCGVLAHKGLAPLAVIAAVALLIGWRSRGWRFPWSLKLLTGPALAALAWGALSALWAVEPDLAISRAAKLTAATAFGVIILVGLVNLPGKRRFQIGIALCIGLALAVVIIAVDLWLEGGLRRAIRDDASYVGMASLNNGMTWIMLLIWPAALWLWRAAGITGRRWLRLIAPVLVAACVPLLMKLESQSSLTAFGLGSATFIAVAAAPRLVPYAMAIGIAVSTVAAPLAVLVVFKATRLTEWFQALPSTMVHRAYIWEFSAQRIMERPLLGWGLDSSRVIPGGHRMVTDVNPDLSHNVYGLMELMPLHPHNAPLQLWLELGLPGALLFVAVTGALLVAIARRVRDRLAAATATTVLVVAIALSSFSYGIWQTWWLAALWIVAALTAMQMRPNTR